MARDPRGLALAKKLTPQEQQEFFDFQVAAHQNVDPGRSPDRNLASGGPLDYIGGLAPEDALLVGKGVKSAARVARAGLNGMADSLGRNTWHPLTGGLAGGLRGILGELG